MKKSVFGLDKDAIPTVEDVAALIRDGKVKKVVIMVSDLGQIRLDGRAELNVFPVHRLAQASAQQLECEHHISISACPWPQALP